MSGRRYTMFSGGEGSYRAAKIDRARHPAADYGLVFTDTLYEDADTYRFLIEAAADVLGRKLDWTVDVDAAPDYRVAEEVPIEEYCGNPEWRAWLADLRARAAKDLPELVWLVEGRDPWEIFRDRRFLGNSQVDLCSRIAKREIADAWAMGNCHRMGELFGDADTFAVGIDIGERHRFDDGEGGGLRPRKAEAGWLYHAPLIDAELAISAATSDELRGPLREIVRLLYAPVEELGVRGQRMYRQGYKHGNCGGFCIKAGMAHWANRYLIAPLRYAYDAMMERKLGAFLGKPVAMLTDRSGGTGKRPLTLDAFARRLRAQPGRQYEYKPGESGCGCMTEVVA
ncbi:hypothetical protein J2X47_001927 [Sphingomonas sp. BE270]|uniref:hypothetical protein n=1 Tax=Sphingomonas sp. BE270 TaxID=2817726 RepID=UPI0028559AF6|nr:hypothetical protein [Sphingomonas sp. BE270]MDR7257747.1 hypothetical protein [Sphingomonas sp. BE270]